MKTLKVGIASYEEMKSRSLAIARGEYKPKRGEPKVWFLSLESFAKVLSDRNRMLLKTIAVEQLRSLIQNPNQTDDDPRPCHERVLGTS